MTKKKRKNSDSDQELQVALQDPNAIVHYNYDGSYNIEYETPSPEPKYKKAYKNYFNTMYHIYHQLTEHCSQQGLSFLDRGNISNFYDLIYKNHAINKGRNVL
uniref:Uncharacterized protein n=1 Tax=Marseillevirus LCMAC202 TaxID=2506606 RepID=A0A481YX53_9VIRU|nr:MAG: hypothetical protein LCMAC202_00350 [Marseillevirus LCMAC202]